MKVVSSVCKFCDTDAVEYSLIAYCRMWMRYAKKTSKIQLVMTVSDIASELWELTWN